MGEPAMRRGFISPLSSWFLGCLCIVAGCSDSNPGTSASRERLTPTVATAIPEAAFGGKEARTFDFGHVIGGPGRTLIHHYQITNMAGRPVRLLRAINSKPCCGEIERFEAATLQPSQSG